MMRAVPQIFLNVVLPFCLFFAFILRPSLISAFYGILLLIWPFVPGVNGNVPEFTKRYLIVSVVVTTCGLLAQSIFQIVLASSPVSKDAMVDCGELASILRVLGLQRLNISSAGNAFRLVMPDIAACLASISTLIVFICFGRRPPAAASSTERQHRTSSHGSYHKSSSSGRVQERAVSATHGDRAATTVAAGGAAPSSPVSADGTHIVGGAGGGGLANNNRKDDGTNRPYMAQLLVVCLARISEALVVLLLCAAAVIYPSILSAVYFLAFLIIMTWWALYRPMSAAAFNLIKLTLAAYSAFHLIVLYLYQTREFQVALPPDTLTARLLGLTVIANTTCSEFWILHFVANQPWPVFANPVVIFAFYMYISLQTVSTYRLLAHESEEDGGESGAEDSTRSRRRVNSMGANATGGGGGVSSGGDHRPRVGSAASNRSKPTFGGHRAVIGHDYKRLFSIGTVPVEQAENKTVGSAVAFVVRHSYAFSLVMMMAWAITYHSWLAFVWLAMACIIWMMADSRRACFLLSPFIVVYAEILLCLQFIYGLNLSQEELPDGSLVNGVPMQQIGLMKPTGAACVPLFVKTFFSIPFWITLRLHLRERHYQRQLGTGASTTTSSGGGAATTTYLHFDSAPPAASSTSGGTIGGIISTHSLVGFVLAKYWIYVVGLVLLLISIRTPVVAYEVCYMAFFVVLITVLQVSFTLWRIMLFLYWTVLTAFSIGVLLLVYTYQFSEVPTWWHNWTRWPNEAFDDLGLVSYFPGTLFVQLLTPISFLIVVILQMKFFHASFMRLTDFTQRASATAKERYETTVQVKGSKWFPIMKKYYEIGCDFFWRIAEIHFTKLVAFAMLMLAVYEISAVNFVFAVVVACMLPCRRLNTVLSVVATIWAALVVVAKMIYQMKFVNLSQLHFHGRNCTSMSYIQDPATWAGFTRLGPASMVAKYLRGYVVVLVLLTFQAIVKIRQRYCREVLGKPTPPRGVLFPGIGRQDVDENVGNCLKYLCNYGFYKFGLEITFVMVIIDVGIRMDAVAFVYTVWLLVMLAMPRRTLGRIWWLFVTFLAISLPGQYAVCVGLPPSACFMYPWYGISSKLANWLFLPNYEVRPNRYFIIADFFLLLMASAQLFVFRVERSPTASSQAEGGDNAPIWHYNPMLKLGDIGLGIGGGGGGGDGVGVATVESGEQQRPQYRGDKSVDDDPAHNPTPNFINHTRSYLDVIKVFVFVYFQWITLFIIFAAGVGGISGFAFGYLVAAFALLWKGNDLYLESHSRIMIRWYILLFYNVFAIMLKISLQVVGCVYKCAVCDSSTSWVVQLFSIACLRGSEEECVSGATCTVTKSEAEIVYDGLCFGFLVFQVRIFSSWYFRHSISEFRAERILSARGAYLINQLIRKEMHEQKEKEDRILRKIKAKTARIRKHYLKQMDGKKHFEPNTYAETKRGGDYYMFDYDSDEDAEELDEHEPIAPEPDHTGEHKGLGPTQLLHIAGQGGDLKEIVSEAVKRDAVIKRELSRDSTFSGQPPPSASSSGAGLSDVRITMSSIPEAVENSDEGKPTENNVVIVDDQDEDEDEADSGKRVEFEAKERIIEDADETMTISERGGGNNVKYGLKFCGMLMGSVLNSLANTFNRWSRDYRYVAFVLKGEKRRLKETLMTELEHQNDFRRMRETLFNQEVSRKIHYIHSSRDIETAEREAQEHALEHNVVARFLIATYYLLVSHTELLCYLMIVLDHMGNAAIISLPLPFLAFFWGTLCSPRPPKFFWVTVITYTEAMIVVKFMFQFGFWQFDESKQHENDPFNGPKILGIEQDNYYAAYDVALLMILFFHRYVLKTLGLWKDAHNEEDVSEMDAEVLSDSRRDSKTITDLPIGIENKVIPVDEEIGDASDIAGGEDGCEFEESICDRRRSVALQGRLAYCSSFISFYRRLLNPAFRYIMDLYSFMFLCDVVCFLILAFGYSAFGEVRGRKYDVVSEIQQNKVPLPFVAMLITLMILIIMDRAIYLSKSVVSKLVFQYFLVTVVHVWVFFGLPAMTDWPISKNGTAQLWYFVKCVYFLLSAWQIRNSYPSRIQGNLLAKKFGLTNYCLFTGFMAAPFLFELRTLIDWIWTETSMPLFDYFTMENMYACIFRSKCMRQYEMEYPVPRDIPKPKWIKYGLGLPILILIVVLLWLPLLLFALVNAIGNRVPPDQAQFSVAIEGHPPFYVMEAQRKMYLRAINDTEYDALYELCRSNKQGTAFLKQYWEKDIYTAHFRSGSISEWAISPSSRAAMLEDLINDTDVVINFMWQFRRPGQSQKQLPQNHLNHNSFELKNDPDGPRIRRELIATLEGRNRKGVHIPRAFPPFLVVPSIGLVQPAKAILFSDHTVGDDIRSTYAGVKLFMSTVQEDFRNGSVVQYWSMQMDPPAWMNNSKYWKPDGDVEVTAFIDRVFPTYLDTFTSGGIIGVYVVVVWAAGKFIRTLVVQSPLDVILYEMPHVDRVLQLCLDVFLVREAGDFLLEQDLFAKLIFLFRSPETLIRWTRPKVE